MLKPIPTVHPVIMFGSLAILAGLIYWSLHSGLQRPESWVVHCGCRHFDGMYRFA
jgi:hypothetical protein